MLEWLETMNLEVLWDMFVDGGFDVSSFIELLSPDNDLLEETGVDKIGHQNRILTKVLID